MAVRPSSEGPDAVRATPASPHAMSASQWVYLWLTSVFVTCLLMANVLGVKLFRIDTGLSWGEGTLRVEHTVGMIAFPITFLLTDLLNEYYGKRAARRAAYVAFAMAALSFVLMNAGRAMPTLEGIPGTASDAAFENIFGSAPLMFVASLVAFLLGSLLDIFLFAVFKRMTGGRLVWLRATGSTVVSQLFDSFVVTFLFFWLLPMLLGRDAAELGFVLATALTGYVLKFAIAVVMTPMIYLGRWVLARFFGLRAVPAGDA